ncbi:hypothetical protein RXV86_03825 [Alisedimentitalea sp. MJ-SS2]|uniref:hypothetical protein n=1 Tax=Aliisedimentitalea sp. MJ-SS2 TaxID=3049795 RepID=UPI002906A978|nr:hypothetical protein [Alisedimentitalea sp. MJ-SS2]MDU8926506.1 hypothetical protein [Alisedimentitalea sp. MJ-SS2]
MKINAVIVSAATLFGLVGSAAAKTTINVSCYRGPLEAVIWDRANPKFVDSLVSQGYSSATASVLADSICRNPGLVANPDRIGPAIRAMIAATPKDG